MAEDPIPSAHDEAFAASRAGRDRTLEAMRALEGALAMASAGETWLQEVATDLEALELALVEEQLEWKQPDALLPMIAADYPRRFGSRVRQLRAQHEDIVRQVATLSTQLSKAEGRTFDAGDIRQRAAWIIRALHHYRARQTDLVYEALERDLGER